MKSLHIEGRRWFQRTYGNTYHTVRVFVDGALAYTSPRQYGYGDQFLETGLQWLKSENLIPDTDETHGTLYLRETLGGSYSVIDVAREKDL